MASVFDSLGNVPDEAPLKKENLEIRRTLRKNRKLAKSKKGAKLRAKLAKNRAKAHPVDPETGARLRDVEREARGATQSKYGETWKKVEGQIGGQKNALANLPTYFDRRREDLTRIGANQAAAAQAIQQQLAQAQAGVEAQTQGFRDTVAAEAGNNPLMASSNKAAQDSSAARQTTTQLAGANIAAVGNISKGTYDGLSNNTRKEQHEETNTIEARIRAFEDERASLAKQIGEDFIGERSDVLSRIGDRQVKAAAVAADASAQRAKLKLDKQKADEAARANRSRERTSRTNARTNRIRANKKKDKDGKVKPVSAKTQNKDYGTILSAAEAYKKYGKELKGSDLSEYVASKVSGFTGGTAIARAAHDIAFNGKLRKSTIKELHSLGYSLQGTALAPYL